MIVENAGIEEAVVETIARVQTDPDAAVDWVTQTLLPPGGELDPFQKELFRDLIENDLLDVKSGNEIGKTYWAACAALWFLFNFIPSSVIVSSSTDRQLVGQFWKELAVLYARGQRNGLPGRIVTKYLDVGGDALKWHLIGFSTRKEAYFEGWHNLNILILFDESKGIDDVIWNGARRMLRGVGGVKKWVATGTPPVAPLGEFCRISLDPKESERWKHRNLSAWDSPRVDKKKCQEDLDTLGPNNPFYLSMVLGQIPVNSMDTMIVLRDIEAAAMRETLDNKDEPEEIQLGVDVSRKGMDETVITKNHNRVATQYIFPGGDENRTTATVVRVKEILKPYGARAKEIPIFVDDTGVGGGVSDMLIAEGYTVVEINFGGEANDHDHYYDFGTEMFQYLANYFKDGNIIIPDDQLLKNQLYVRTLKYFRRKSSLTVIKLLSKEELRRNKELVGVVFRSPDRADSLALAFAPYPPINKKKHVQRVGLTVIGVGSK